MGFESFRVEFRNPDADFLKIDHYVRTELHGIDDSEASFVGGSNYYTVSDDRAKAVIEMEVDITEKTISCRFTLCHPPIVDVIFSSLIRRLVNKFQLEVRICDTDATNVWYPSADLELFDRNSGRLISKRRNEWITQFGKEQFPATTVEVYSQIILPHCKSLHAIS